MSGTAQAPFFQVGALTNFPYVKAWAWNTASRSWTQLTGWTSLNDLSNRAFSYPNGGSGLVAVYVQFAEYHNGQWHIGGEWARTHNSFNGTYDYYCPDGATGRI